MLSKWGADFDKNYYLKITELNDKAIVKNSSFGIKSLFETIEKNLDLGNVYDISTSQTGFEQDILTLIDEYTQTPEQADKPLSVTGIRSGIVLLDFLAS